MRGRRRILLAAVLAFVVATPAGATEYGTPAYHADPLVTCIDGGPQAPELVVIDEPVIYAMPGQPFQVVGWLPILYRSQKGTGGPQDFGPYELDSPVTADQIRWYIAGSMGRYQGTPEQLTFQRVEGARFKVVILYLWLDPQGNVVGSDVQLTEKHMYTAEFFPFPLPYCDFAAFDVVPMLL